MLCSLPFESVLPLAMSTDPIKNIDTQLGNYYKSLSKGGYYTNGAGKFAAFCEENGIFI